MAEEKKKEQIEAPHTPIIDEETAQKLGDASVNRIKMIQKMVKEYYRAINGSINSLEMYQLGVDAILAGFGLISRSNDMEEYDVDTRISIMNASLNVVINVLNKVYLDPKVVAGQVAQAALESAQRQGIKFNGKK
jgi:hypothetical protein